MLQYVTVCYPQVGLAVCLSPSAIYTKSSVKDITLQYVTLHYIYTTVCSSTFNLRYSMLKYIYLHYDTLQYIYIESLSRESVKGRSIYLFAVVETAPIATAYQPLCGRVARRFVRLFSARLICCRRGLGEGFWQRRVYYKTRSFMDQSLFFFNRNQSKTMFSILNACILLHYNFCRLRMDPRYVEVLWSISIRRGLYGLIDWRRHTLNMLQSGRACPPPD